MLVDQAVGQQEHLHTQRLSHHVFAHIVAYHDAFFGAGAQRLQDLEVVVGGGLAEAAVLVGGIQGKVVLVQTGPADPALGGDGGEDGVGGQYRGEAPVFDRLDHLSRSGVEAADLLYLLEARAVEGIEFGLVPKDGITEDGTELVPEHFFVGAVAAVSDHGGGAGPDGTDQLFRIVAVRGKGGGQPLEVGFDEQVLIHGEQGAVQIEQDVTDGHGLYLVS